MNYTKNFGFKHKAGVVMPVSSLPSKYGIGSFGKAAFDFIDFLDATGQKCWQVLPLNPTSYGDSPYQSPSTVAGNPYFIDLDILAKKGLLVKEELEAQLDDSKKINCQTEVKNLEMLLSGNSAKDSTELLDSDCFKEFLNQVKNAYDVIILDTPSMKDSIDAAVAARQCEGTLIVITAEKTKNKEAKDMKLQIEKIGGRILGCAVIKQR